MIELQHVTKKYADTIAVNDLSLEVLDGEVSVLIGPSGCGKSTTLKMINSMLEPTSGDIIVNGTNVRRLEPEDLRRGIGYVIQNIGLFPHMTVAKNISVVPRLLGWDKNRIDKRTDELLKLIDLGPQEYRGKYPHELSGGEAQRIGVARALAADPPILLMDEPFGAVDPLTRERLQVEFARIQKQLRKTVVFVTHDLDEAIRLADQIILMRKGQIAQHDTPEQILAHPNSKFVRDFIGTDRALKRLSRYMVCDYMHAPTRILSKHEDMSKAREQMEQDARISFGWVVDDDKKLLGWIDARETPTTKDVKKSFTHVEAEELCVEEDSTLKDALSRMLSQGVKTVPVVDSGSRLVGEIDLHDIELLTEEAEN